MNLSVGESTISEQSPEVSTHPESRVRRATDRPASDRAAPLRLWDQMSIPFWIGASRIALGVVFAHLVVVLLPQSRQHITGATLNSGTWLGTFDRWDSGFYLNIAQHGYPSHNTFHAAAFFPGYPLLIAVAHAVTFGTLTYLNSAMVVSWLAFTAAAVVLYRLAARVFSPRVGLIATVLFCWFPASLFFMSPYSESLFALEILVVLALIERHRFLAAALVAAFASATSPESVALTIALVVAAALAGRGLARVVAYGVISGLGVAGYMLLLWVRFGHPLEFITVQKYWKRSEHFPFVGLYRNVLALLHYVNGVSPLPGGTSPTFTNIKWVWILDDGALVLATLLLCALIGLWVVRTRRHGLAEFNRRTPEPSDTGAIPISFLVVTFVIVLLAACTTISPYALPTYASSEGEARFVSIAFPLYLSGALLIRRNAALISFAVGGSIVVALLFQAMYNLGYWVT